MSDILIIDSRTKIRDLLLGKEGVPEEFAYYQASSKNRAWEGVQAMPTEIVIFPLHFSEDKCFEGLWLAEKIIESNLDSKIIITSRLNFKKRSAIIQFFDHRNVHAPYEETEFIIPCLVGNCGCIFT